MIRSYRLRRLLAPAAGFRKSVLSAALGLACLFLGMVLSFRDSIVYGLDSVSRQVNKLLILVGNVETQDMARHLLGGAFLVLGIYLLYRGVRFAFGHVFRTLTDGRGRAVDLYRKRLQLAEGPRIVALGGGTGLSTLLRGLKQHSSNITAIVTVTDDGGSSGRLSQEKGIIPPGDIRNCLVALADAEKSMTDLFQHRFTKNSGSLSGHSLGNLLIAALVDQSSGDFEKALEIASDVLAIRGQVLPSTLDHVGLRGIMEDNSEILGETAIVSSAKRVRRIFLDCEDTPRAHPSAIEAIKNADLICVGPGSVFTSVIPNLLVPGIAQALKESTAKKIYICNVMTQRGESDSFSASEHVSAIDASLDHRLFDYVFVNTAVPTPGAIEKYRGANQFIVDADLDRIRAKGYKVIAGDFMNESDLVRHDPMKIASRMMQMLNRD